MNTINIKINDFKNAPDGSILIKKNGNWNFTSFDELNKNNVKQLNQIEALKSKIQVLEEYNKHLPKYAKAHFINVFNYFKMKIILGEINVVDETILTLDDAVLNNTISVQDALSKHEFLYNTYKKLYLDNTQIVFFPQL